MRRPVFLDRDGVINRDLKPYIVRADQIELLDGALEGLLTLHQAGYDIYVVSNQQGVAKGYIPLDELPRMSERIQSFLRPHGFEIKHFEYCTALEGDGNPCRKPAPGMIFSVQKRFELDLGGSFLIGDRWSDIEAAGWAGLRPLLVLTGVTASDIYGDWEFQPEAVFPSLKEAALFVSVNGPNQANLNNVA